ncbi:MAG: hypothetical protein EOP09_00095 [Proteobacteria bacterium]|nr:MAG: hypothetical protein EOP09_00095 [Pseudomonadota bacterium]
MVVRLLIAIGCVFLLSGCDLMRMLWPSRAATHQEAEAAVKRCHLPAGAYWRITKDGLFVFGRMTLNASPIPKQSTKCLIKWTQGNRIKAAFVGWEADGL